LLLKNVKVSLAQGFGDSNPVTSDDTPEDRFRNHRIEVTVMGLVINWIGSLS